MFAFDLFLFSEMSGQLVLKNTAFYATVATTVNDGSPYPFLSGIPRLLTWVPKMRIVRSQLFSDAFKCDASRTLTVEPIPTIVRVTGFQSSHPAYGFYVADSATGVMNNALVYRFVS